MPALSNTALPLSFREDTRQRLIRVGTEVLSEKGFGATGIQAILEMAGVPKGSFYYYFKSKNDFGLKVIDNYADLWEKKLLRLLGDAGVPPLRRIDNYIDEALAGLEKYGFRRGCLIGNMAQELAGLEEVFRTRLVQVFSAWSEQLAQCLQQAKDAGSLSSALDPKAVADFFWMAWEGAVLRAKLDRSTAPILQFRSIFFQQILVPPRP